MKTWNGLAFALGAVLCLQWVGCGGSSNGGNNGGGGNTTPTLQSIQVSPSSKSLYTGQTQQFKATGTYSDGSTKDLTSTANWISSDSTIATVSTTGLATASSKAGTATITASSSGISGSAQLTAIVVQSIAVTPANPTINKGATQQFTATGTYSDGSQQTLSNVTWASSATAVATISSGGLATGAGAGTSTISATLSGISGSTVLTVSNPLVSIAVSPPSATLDPSQGQTQQFAATGTYADKSTQNITTSVAWSASPTGVTITSGGLASSSKPGTYTITATLNGISGTATLTVTNPIVSIAVSPSIATAYVGFKFNFTAQATYYDKSASDITFTATWASSDTTVATMSQDVPGQANALKAGTTTITASQGGKSGQATLTVNANALVSIAVTPANDSLLVGYTKQYTAMGTFSDGKQQDITSSVTWSTSDATIASITVSGLAIGLKPSQSTIQVVATDPTSGIQGSTGLTVYLNLVSIAIKPATLQLAPGTSQALTAIGTYGNGNTQNVTQFVTWSTSNNSEATVTTGGVVKAVSQGTPTIAATYNSVSSSLQVTVSNATLNSITVTPVNQTIAPQTYLSFVATGTFSDATTQTITNDCSWTSSNLATASMSGSSAKGVAQGTTTIAATFKADTTKSGSTTLNVSNATLTSIAVAPSNAVMAPGTTQGFNATGTFSDGSQQNVNALVTWNSSDNKVVQVNTSGVATGESAGVATITASYTNASSGTANVIVNASQLQKIVITHASAEVPNGFSASWAATGYFDDGSQQVLTNFVKWASSAPSVATVSGSGLVTGVSIGSSNITAAFGNVIGTATANVTGATLTQITVSPSSASVNVGSTQVFTATGTFSDGLAQFLLTNQVTWSSSDVGVAVVSASGVATGVSPGTATIGAAIGSVSNSATLTVH